MNANSTEFCLKAMPKAVNTHATWALLAGGKCTCQAEGKTKFYNQLKPEIISILFKKKQFGKTSTLNVQAVRFSKTLLTTYRTSPHNVFIIAPIHSNRSTKTFAKIETETSVKVFMLTRQPFKGMFYSNETSIKFQNVTKRRCEQ